MFQDGSDRRPTDSPQTLSVSACRTDTPSDRGRRTLRAVFARSNDRRRGPAHAPRRATKCSSVHRRANAAESYNTATERERTASVTFSRGLRPPANRSWRSTRGKGTRRSALSPPNRSVRIRARRRRTHDGLNSAGRLCGPIRLPLNGFTYC